MIREYRKYIAENRNIVYISTLFALVLRWISFSFFEEHSPESYDGSFLWKFISPFFDNTYVSHLTAFLFSVGLSLYMLHLNDKYAIIRVRTSLSYAFLIFLLSCFPSLAVMSPVYFSLLFVLIAVGILYSSYRKEKVAESAFRISFLLALGSLFTIDLLLYIPLFWIGYAVMRSFNYKAILASLLGVCMVYWIVGFCILYFSGLDNPLLLWIDKWKNYEFPALSKQIIGFWAVFIINALVVVFIIVYGYAYSYKDKVQIRAYISFINLLFIFSLLISVILLLQPDMSIAIVLVASSFIYSHYFALADQKGNVYFFIAVILFFLMSFFYMSNITL